MKINKHFIIGAVVFQALILSMLLFQSWKPFKAGTPIIMEVSPLDPRDIFRGQYVDLDYRFNSLPAGELQNDFYAGEEFYAGDKFYLELDTIQHPEVVIREAIGVYKEKPKGDAMILKAELTRDFTYSLDNPQQRMRLVGGIEQYYTSPEAADSLGRALSWNNRLENRVLAKVTVDRDGDARLTGLEVVERVKPFEVERRNRRSWWWWD